MVLFLEISKIVAPCLAALIAWILTIRSLDINKKRDRRKKLNRILYFLLEVRWGVLRELNYEKEVNAYLRIATDFVKERWEAKNVDDGIKMVRPLVVKAIQDKILSEMEASGLEEKVDQVVTDLAEIDPILAYELSGSYNISQRKAIFVQFFDKMEISANENDLLWEDNNVLMGHFQSKLLDKLLRELEECLLQVSRLSGNKVYSEAKDILKSGYKEQVQREEVEDFFNVLLEPIMEDIKK